MNSYLINSKVRLIKQAKQDLLDLYGIDASPFTRKIYFYFHVHDNKKYVHKESLRFIYSNAETYTDDIDPQVCRLTKQIDPVDVCQFLEQYQGSLLPQLLDSNDKFLVYQYEDGSLPTSINTQEFYELKQHHDSMDLTPFYNSMTYNILRADRIKLIDLKHFEVRDDKPFYVYMYNQEAGINVLYLEHDTDHQSVYKHLEKDYPVANATKHVF